MKLHRLMPNPIGPNVRLVGKIAMEHRPYTKSFNPEVLGCMAKECDWESKPTELAYYEHVLDVFRAIKDN